MQYITHPEFMESVYRLYRQNGVYKKVAETALSIWAKAHNTDVFQQKDVFERAKTHYGENRLRHCRKYNLSKGCRLVTAFDQDTLIFLFLGMHEECDRWLDNNRGRNFFDNIKVGSVPVPSTTMLPVLGQPIVVSRQWGRKELFRLQADIKDYVESEGYQDNFIFAERGHAFEHNIQAFLQQDCVALSGRFDGVSQSIGQYLTGDAMLKVNELEYYLDFLSLKLKYLDKLKQLVAVRGVND